MILGDLGMLLVSTPRSRIYLQTLVARDLLPSFVMIMHDPESSDPLPGQTEGDVGDTVVAGVQPHPDEALTVTLERAGIPYLVVPTRDVNSPEVVAALARRTERFFVYSGVGGAIVGGDVLGTGKRLLHIHPGIVPHFRGSTTVYFSILADDLCGATAFFLESSIDTGPVVAMREFPKPVDGTSIDYGYDPEIRSALLADVVSSYAKTGEFPSEEQDPDEGTTYYIIHPVLKHLAIMSCEEH